MNHRNIIITLLIGLAMVLAMAAPETAQAAKRGKIDFMIQKVWVGPDCKVMVRLVRKGPGQLSPKKMAKVTILVIRVGKQTFGYSFKEVDPAGRLLAGPGVVDYRSPIRVSGKQTISAMVDPRNKITEAVERKNNIARLKGIPKKCLVSSARDTLRALKVTEAYMARGGLNVVIAKERGFKLDRNVVRRIQLRVQSKAQRKAWQLDQALTKAKRGPKGTFHFKTGLKVKPGTTVRVSFKLGKLTRQRVLAVAAPAAVKTPSGKKPRRITKIPPALKALIAQRGLKTKGRAKSHSRGIRLILPAGDNRFRPGSTVNMGIRMDAGLDPGFVIIWVLRGSQEQRDFTLNGSSFYYTGTAVDITRPIVVPEDAVPSDRYYVMALRNDSAWGFSDMFTVTGAVLWGPAAGESEEAPFEIRLAAPNRMHPVWIKGNTYTISWRVIGDQSRAQTFDVSLERAGRRLRSIESGAAVWHRNSQTWTLSWNIPNDLQTGDDYKIRVREHSTGLGDVSEENFSIRGSSDLAITWPPRPGFVSTPVRVAQRNNYEIRWTATGSYASSAVNILLLSRLTGVPDVTLARNIRASTGRFPWPVGTDCGTSWYTPGQGYRVRVEVAGGDRSFGSTSDAFSIVSPSVTVRSDQSGRPWQMGQRKIIRWSFNNMPDNAALRLVLYKGGESWMDIARHIPVTRLQFVWTVGHEVGTDMTPVGMGGPPPPPPADDYSIKVLLENCHRVSSQTIQFRIE